MGNMDDARPAGLSAAGLSQQMSLLRLRYRGPWGRLSCLLNEGFGEPYARTGSLRWRLSRAASARESAWLARYARRGQVPPPRYRRSVLGG